MYILVGFLIVWHIRKEKSCFRALILKKGQRRVYIHCVHTVYDVCRADVKRDE